MSNDPMKTEISKDGLAILETLIDDVSELKARDNPRIQFSCMEFYFSSSIVAPPANASFIFDNANIALATAVHIDDNARNGLDVRAILQMFATNDIALFTHIGNSNNAILCLISNRVNPVGYITYNLTSIAVVGTHIDGELYYLELFTL